MIQERTVSQLVLYKEQAKRKTRLALVFGSATGAAGVVVGITISLSLRMATPLAVSTVLATMIIFGIAGCIFWGFLDK